MRETFDAIRAAIAYLGMIASYILGPMNGLLITLCVFMALDYITGVTAAIISHSLSSEVGFVGLARKCGILVLVCVGYLIDTYVIGFAGVRTMVILWYLANEGVSILENAGKIGLPVPDKLRSILAQLSEDKNDDE